MSPSLAIARRRRRRGADDPPRGRRPAAAVLLRHADGSRRPGLPAGAAGRPRRSAAGDDHRLSRACARRRQLSGARARAGRCGRGAAAAPRHGPRHRADQSLRERASIWPSCAPSPPAPAARSRRGSISAWTISRPATSPGRWTHGRRTAKARVLCRLRRLDGGLRASRCDRSVKVGTGCDDAHGGAARATIGGTGSWRWRGSFRRGHLRSAARPHGRAAGRASTPRACAPCSRPTTSATPRTTGSWIPATRSGSSSSPGRSTPAAGCASPRSSRSTRSATRCTTSIRCSRRSRAIRASRRLARALGLAAAAAAAVDVHLQAAADRRRGGLPPGQHASCTPSRSSCVGFWLALEDATETNGCMWAEPGGHRRPLHQRFVRDGRRTRMVTLDPDAAAERRAGAAAGAPRAR